MSEITRDLSDLAGAWAVREKAYQVVGGSAGVQVAARDPLRFGLTIANASTSTGPFSLTTTGGFATGAGITVPQNGVFQLSYRAHPGLVQSAWFVATTMTSTVQVSVLEELAQQ